MGCLEALGQAQEILTEEGSGSQDQVLYQGARRLLRFSWERGEVFSSQAFFIDRDTPRRELGNLARAQGGSKDL